MLGLWWFGFVLFGDGLCEYLLCVCVDYWCVYFVGECGDGLGGVGVDVGKLE